MRRTLLLMSAVLFSFHGLLYAQERIVSGKVVAQDGKAALPGVTVAVKGTTQGTSTDEDGNFTVSVPDASAVLVFSFIGYKTTEVIIGTRTTLDVTLETDETQLTELVVTGYGDAERKALTGTINTVSGKQIQDVPIASIDQILQGRSPGVLVMGSSGQPGAAATVTIRGRGSISASTTPLYVLDGVPIDPTSFNTLNPNDYDIVNILTDASATSIYGSRAANGVILLNSKKGKAGKTRFTYRTQYGVAQRPSNNKLKLMNSNQKIDYELMVGGSPIGGLSAEEIDALRKINTDWAKILFQNATYQTHEVSAQGGNEKTTFFFSGAYLKQDGTVKTTSLERYTSRLNLAHESGSFRFGVNSTFGFSKNKLTREGDTYIGSPLNAIRWANPYETPYDENGEYTVIRTGQPNPLQELTENTQQSNDAKVVGNIYAAYDLPIKGLTARTSFGMDYGQSDQTFYNDRTTNAGSQSTGGDGSLTRAFGYDARFINTNSLNYSTTFGEDHSLSVGLYQETNFRQVSGFTFTGFGLTGNLKNEAGLTVSSTYLPTLGGNKTESGLSSVFGDIRYGFKDRYHLSVGVRRDGSSRFGSGNQYATFYSVGANWIISDEAFFQNLSKTVNLVKLNASFGTSGNQEGIGDFQSRELYSAAGVTYDGQAGILQTQLANPDLKWETQKMFDISLEYGLFNDRVTGKFGFYNRLTEDLLYPSPLSLTTGYGSLTQNVGSLRNRGFEISVGADVIRSNGFVWNVNANFTYNKNEVVEIYGDLDELPTGLTILKKGKPIGTNYMVEYAGVNPANGNPLYRKLDGTLTSEFSLSDVRTWGTRFAPRFGGFTNTFSYRGIELSIFFTWVHGNQIYNNDRTNVENPTYFVDQMAASMLTAWKQPGDITEVPRVTPFEGSPAPAYQAQTTRYLENGSFLRLRNVLLSYDLPSTLVSKARLSNVRVFVQGQNLFTRTEFLGWDPELAAGTLTGAQYPSLRTITAGLNIGF